MKIKEYSKRPKDYCVTNQLTINAKKIVDNKKIYVRASKSELVCDIVENIDFRRLCKISLKKE